MRVLYLTHDITDPTTKKRVAMLRAGGADVRLGGFTRRDAPTEIEGARVTVLGRTGNGRFAQRILAVIKAIVTLPTSHALYQDVDHVIARNLEMLAVATAAKPLHRAPITYEVLDIHRLLLREDLIGKVLRRLEAFLARRASHLITSSPAFIREYLEKRNKLGLPITLVENKVFGLTPTVPPARPAGPPWRIGWFGALRCHKSFGILCDVARANPGLVEVVMRGRPSYDQIPHFDQFVASTPGVSYLGPYTNPDDLAAIYGEVHFSWAIDMFEEGLNSSWLLPNRIYEGGLFGAVPIAAQGVETAHFIQSLGIGHILNEPKAASLTEFLKSISAEYYQQLASAVTSLPQRTWLASDVDCVALVSSLRPTPVESQAPSAPLPDFTGMKPVLVVIPCLNEVAHIANVLRHLVDESAHLPMRIVVADGGSTDGTIGIIQQWAAAHGNITYLPNPKRIQSAAINLAVAQYAGDADYLIRLDAHADFPPDYCRQLVADAMRTGADSVTIAMNTVGKGGFHDAVAAAQNSKLGNGGSAHRSTLREGKWVEHAHHALFRIAAFTAIGGYDETFTHNEDAEFDARLTAAGYRIWLSANTTHLYYPRANPLALFRQYRQYGFGRVRTLLKHRQRPRIRQMLPVAVLPAILLLLLSPFLSFAALPFLLWAGLCLAYGCALAWVAQKPHLALSGPAAMIMHSGWSLGFWQGLYKYGKLRA